ncbi:hypothetical protein MKW94_000652 [Papaver nudicaule]|uniref:Phytocyanin domain-containing protein n=1 Tax=Papaver nudicaule TaxID=74823 RepID=A0AA41SI79_PAPNU|nr:hypothetical protein [Papaver nudicaule]
MDISRRRLMVTVFIASSLIMMLQCCDAVRHNVGGTKNDGWIPNKMNYTSDWAAHEQFYVGDWLYWGYYEPRINRQLYSVFEVNKMDYDSCSTDHPLYNISRGGGRDVYQLNQSRPYYFISGGGFCWQGMKLTVFVQELPPAPAAAPSTGSYAAPSTGSSASLSASLSGIFSIFATAAALVV